MKSNQRQHDKDSSKVNQFLQLSTHFSRDNKRKHSFDQWNPLHPTDLGQTLIGIDQLLETGQKDHHEVFLLLIEHITTALLPQRPASNGPSVRLASNGPSVLYLQFLDRMHLRLHETLLLTYQALKACLIHPNETCLCTITCNKCVMNSMSRTKRPWSS